MFPTLIAAAAPPYPAPPVTPAYHASPVFVVSGGPLPGVVHNADTTLASAGIGFSIGTLPAVAVLLLGIAMIVTVRRFRTNGR